MPSAMGRPVASTPWVREDGDGLVLMLHVQPGAKRTELFGLHGEGSDARLKIRVAAPATDGKANAELVRFLAEAFGVPASAVTLLRGVSARQKSVRIARPRLRPDRDWH